MRIDVTSGRLDLVNSDRAPIFAVHAAVDDEAKPELCRVQAWAARQLSGIEDVAARATCDEGRELSGGELVLVENQNLGGPLSPDGMGVAPSHGPQRGSQHEVDVDLDAALPPERGRIGQPPLAAGMLGRGPLDGEAHAARDLLQGLLDARPLGDHRRAVR